MKYSVLITETAVQDLAKIVAYITDHFGETVADKAVLRLKRTLRSLEDFPEAGKPAKSISRELEGMFFLFSEKNVIFYEVADEQQQVTILRLFGTRQDYAERIRKHLNEQSRI